MKRYTWTWIIWLGTFVVAEAFALFNKKPGDTLSEHAWRWFAVKDEADASVAKQPLRVRRVVLIGFLGWLLVHLGWGV